MAYQNVGKPRFYVNVLEWLKKNNVSNPPSIFNTLPVAPTSHSQTTINNINNTIDYGAGGKSFIALLGHNMAEGTYSVTTNDPGTEYHDEVIQGVDFVSGVVHTGLAFALDEPTQLYGGLAWLDWDGNLTEDTSNYGTSDWLILGEPGITGTIITSHQDGETLMCTKDPEYIDQYYVDVAGICWVKYDGGGAWGIDPDYELIPGSEYTIENVQTAHTDVFGSWEYDIPIDVILEESLTDYVNGGTIEYDGFSISTFNGIDASQVIVTASGDIGSIIVGSYYDMTQSPNLSLKMNREYGGTKEITTYNGSSISNTMWSSPPSWGSLGSWELDDGTIINQSLSRSGRRTWSLKFSYLDDGNLFGSNQTLTQYLETSSGYSGDISLGNLGDNLVINGGMETDAYWSEVSNCSEFGQHTSEHEGDFSWRFLGNSLGDGLASADFEIVAGVLYQATFWHRIATYSERAMIVRVQQGDGSDMTNSLMDMDGNPLGTSYPVEVPDSFGWRKGEFLFEGQTSGEASHINFLTGEGVGGTRLEVYIDDVSIKSVGDEQFIYNLLSDDNFFSQVWHKTLGGTLPFLFQPDNSNNNPDQFAICRFVEDSLEVKQSAFNVYDISLKIEEVW